MILCPSPSQAQLSAACHTSAAGARQKRAQQNRNGFIAISAAANACSMIGTYASIVVNGVPPASAVDPRGDEMNLYNSIGPNPKVVRMFMAGKGIELPKVRGDSRAAGRT